MSRFCRTGPSIEPCGTAHIGGVINLRGSDQELVLAESRFSLDPPTFRSINKCSDVSETRTLKPGCGGTIRLQQHVMKLPWLCRVSGGAGCVTTAATVGSSRASARLGELIEGEGGGAQEEALISAGPGSVSLSLRPEP